MNKKGFVVLKSGTVSNNTAQRGGGIYKDFNGNFFLYGGTVKNNTATEGEGKDIYLDTNKFSGEYNYFAFKGNFEVGSPIFVYNGHSYATSYDDNRIISDTKINDYTYVERDILKTVSEYVKPGGTLIYSTCTIQDNENIEVIREEVKEIPKDSIVIIATGPLTSEILSEKIKELTDEKAVIKFEKLN